MNRGPISSFLSGCFVGNNDSGIGTGSHLQKTVQQRYSQGNTGMLRTLDVLGNYIPVRSYLTSTGLFLTCSRKGGPVTSFGPNLGFKACQNRSQRSNGHATKYYTIRLGPKAQWAQDHTRTIYIYIYIYINSVPFQSKNTVLINKLEW